jgi:hypothetical protein
VGRLGRRAGGIGRDGMAQAHPATVSLDVRLESRARRG